MQAEPGSKDTLDTAVEATLRTQHGLATSDQNDFQIVDASSISSAVSSSTKTLTRLMAAIAAISLIVGGIGVANVMLVTVRERTREIGVRRAVGATRRDIVVQFLVDAVVISLIGGVIGLIVGFVGAFAGGSALGVTPVFSWTAVILAIVRGARRRGARRHRPGRAGLVGRADQRAALGVAARRGRRATAGAAARSR